MTTTEYAVEMLGELKSALSRVSVEEPEAIADAVLEARRVFVAGSGRSGLMIRAFAMRLVHLGLETYVAGETVTPKIEAGDLLLIGSGSGETSSLVSMARTAETVGARVALVGIFPQSSVGRIADVVARLPAPTPKAAGASKEKSIQPMGSLFEQCLLLLLDALVLRLMERLGTDSNTMFARHANLE